MTGEPSENQNRQPNPPNWTRFDAFSLDIQKMASTVATDLLEQLNQYEEELLKEVDASRSLLLELTPEVEATYDDNLKKIQDSLGKLEDLYKQISSATESSTNACSQIPKLFPKTIGDIFRQFGVVNEPFSAPAFLSIEPSNAQMVSNSSNVAEPALLSIEPISAPALLSIEPSNAQMVSNSSNVAEPLTRRSNRPKKAPGWLDGLQRN